MESMLFKFPFYSGLFLLTPFFCFGIWRYSAMTYADEANGWYGGTLLGDQDENSEIYKHYAELCQVMECRLFDTLQII